MPSTCNFRRLAVTIYIGNYFLRVISVEWPPPNGEFLFFLAGNTLPLLKEGANKRGNSSRLTQSFHFFMFEPIFSPVNALNQPI
ncbi:hypothetical protein EA184_22010 [Escherichia coli]|nr:hypothetical protein EA184_22010 [Escherichia coli]